MNEQLNLSSSPVSLVIIMLYFFRAIVMTMEITFFPLELCCTFFILTATFSFTITLAVFDMF